MASTKIPILFLIDVEPNRFFTDRRNPVPWLGYEKAFEYMKSARRRLSERTGSPAKFCWGYRMDAQIRDTYGSAEWAITHYPEYFQHFLKEGDALGVHTHPYRWDEGRQSWVIDQGNPAWVEHCVRMSVEAFQRSTDRPCDFFRFGDRWMSNEAMMLLDKLGVPYDLSLEPGTKAKPTYHPGKPYTGSIPDQRGMPCTPYRPSLGNFRLPDPKKKDGLRVIPLTTALLRPRFKFWKKSFYETINLYLSLGRVTSLIDQALKEKRNYLTMVVRTNTFLEGENSGHVESILNYLLKHPLASDFKFTTPAEMFSPFPDFPNVHMPWQAPR